ncbi:hypothetical protein ELUMI_v1c05140 [Williamsoniiplasma luminosum]|uniref:Uncharacterized protein n=1 Tax=Williamsoniiplasma luminosum TaxID=214888 RepID=A0A2K8NVN1_9MOLU|nr:hypothetical protein [Williamsoniiplasma luminosum]ATZ17238.1 hypothetical protein ELUMI_v1c05140 [Williamsoniiplasma luminosum]
MEIALQLLALLSVGFLGVSIFFLLQRWRLKKKTKHIKKAKINLKTYLRQKKQEASSTDSFNTVKETIVGTLDNDASYQLLHKKLKLQFWICFGITVVLWIIFLSIGFGSGFFQEWVNLHAIGKALVNK